MFEGRQGVVSIWVGIIEDEAVLHKYLDEEYSGEDGPLNQFANDAGDTWYDHDFIECSWQDEVTPIGRLFRNHSHWRSFQEQAAGLATKAKIDRANTLVLLYDQELNPVRWPSNSPIQFLGTLPYTATLPVDQKPLDHITGHTYGDLGISCLKFTPDNRFLVTAGDDATLIVWDSQSGQPVLEPQRCFKDHARFLGFSECSTRCVVASMSHVCRWDRFPTADFKTNPIRMFCKAITPDGQYGIGYACSATDLSSGESLGHECDLVDRGIAVIDRHRLLMVTEEQQLGCWNFVTGKIEWLVETPHESYNVFSSPVSDYAATVEDETVTIWSYQGSVANPMCVIDHARVRHLEFCSEEQVVIIDCDGRICQFNIENGKMIRGYERADTEYWSGGLQLAPAAGLMIAVDTDYFFADIWNFKNGKWICRYEPNVDRAQYPFGVLSRVAISPDGKTIAAGEPTGIIHIVEISGGQAKPLRPIY